MAKGNLTFGDQFAAAATLTGIGGKSGKPGQLSVLMLGTSVYTEIPEHDRSKHDGKSWLGSDLARPDADPDETVRYLDNIDPVRQIQALLSARSTTATGPETVEQTTTVRFAATLPLAQYLSRTDPAVRTASERYLAAHGGSEVKIEVWVDTKYQARQCRFTAGDLDLTVTYRDLGKSVVVKAPPADESIDATGTN